MTTSRRDCAPGAPPVSGAWSGWPPAEASRVPSARTVAGALVLRSTRTDPACAPSSHAPATCSTTAGVGSDRKVISLRSATLAGEPAARAPRPTSGRTRSDTVSWTVTRFPSWTRLLAIAAPMLPHPMTPTRSPVLMARSWLSRGLAFGLSFGRHADGAVQADGLAVQHDVLEDVADQRRVLARAPQARRERDLRRQRLAQRLRRHGEHRRVERPGRDGEDADAEGGQVARDRQRHADHTALRRRVRGLADLAVVRRDRRCVDDDATLALVVGRVLRHLCRRQADDVERPDQVHLDHLGEEIERVRALAG